LILFIANEYLYRDGEESFEGWGVGILTPLDRLGGRDRDVRCWSGKLPEAFTYFAIKVT
jgi:hypothetical protein